MDSVDSNTIPKIKTNCRNLRFFEELLVLLGFELQSHFEDTKMN